MPLTYLEWNDGLASRIFRPEMSGRQVFFFVNDDLIGELGGRTSVRDFVASVEEGPPWVRRNLGLCQKALHALDDWRNRGREFPPYLGYLGLFVLAAGVEGSFAPHAYYPRLRTLLGWPDVEGGSPASFHRMLELWEDLETWSNQDKRGTLGVFRIRIAGEWIHVGLPKAQAVLTEHERRTLPRIFEGASLDPMAPPSDTELRQALRRYGGNALRPQTLRLLARAELDRELFDVLLDVIRSELENWDGVASPHGEAGPSTITAVARVCMRVDEIAGRTTATLRVAANAELPEDGLLLESDDRSMRLSCTEYLGEWSTTLRDLAKQRDADASRFNWSESLMLTDSAAGWRVRLPGARVRIFVSGLPFDLPGLVEVHRVPGNRPFWLAASAGAIPAITAWGASGEVDLTRLHIADGLPDGWCIFKSVGAKSDQTIRRSLPELALPTTVRILLRGGIRSAEGDTYFIFAPPFIVVEGLSEGAEVVCLGTKLQAVDGTSMFELPPDLPAGSRITIEVRVSGETLRQQSLFLSDAFKWNLAVPLCTSDAFGTVHTASGELGVEVAGALGGATPEAEFPARLDVPVRKRVFIVGRHPGQIRYYPRQSLPREWEPVWVVEVARRGRTQYCGRDIRQASPAPNHVGSREDVALWRDVLWRRRKRIKPPDHPAVRKLWREYVSAADDVYSR